MHADKLAGAEMVEKRAIHFSVGVVYIIYINYA